MLKILHLTDLHICDAEVLNKLQPVLEDLSVIGQSLRAIHQEIPPEISLDHADEGRLNRIIDITRHEKPDLIAITGDITTFGDKKSFDKAKEFIRQLRLAGQHPAQPEVITVPGNHDVLAGAIKGLAEKIQEGIDTTTNQMKQQLPRFLRDAPFPLGAIGKVLVKKKSNQFRFRRTVFESKVLGFVSSAVQNVSEVDRLTSVQKKLDALLADSSINADSSNPWNNYETFSRDSATTPGNWQSESVGTRILCSRYNSVSQLRYFLNLGTISPEKIDQFKHENDRLNIKAEKDQLYIVLLHHNPISSPEKMESPIVNAYNSMPGGSVFIRTMLNQGVDLILYGHQHEQACMKLDVFQLDGNASTNGHLFLLGGPSATIGNKAGFNIIEIESRFLAFTSKYVINRDSGQYERNQTRLPLIFENEYPLDTATISTRKEIRHSSYDGSTMEWDRVLGETDSELFLIGPRQESLIEFGKPEAIKRAIVSNNCKINILLTEPKLFTFIDPDGRNPDLVKKFNVIWDINDSNFSWRNQSRASAQAIVHLLGLREELNQHGIQYSDALQIRTSHTLMSIGARGKDLEKETGYLLIRLLPVGVFSDFDHLPVITLRKRYDKALFDYYQQYVAKLWHHANRVEHSSKGEYEEIGNL